MAEESDSGTQFASGFEVGSVPIGTLIQDHKAVATLFAPYDRVRLAATFGALLAEPSLLANSHRLETLVHLALLVANGTKKPDDAVIEKAFNAMTNSWVGQLEDPSEDVSVCNIETPVENFRVLGGSWESTGFYQQHLVDTLNSLGDRGLINSLRASVYALLRLSDEICRRAGLERNHLGPEMPLKALPSKIRKGVGSWRRIVRFSLQEIAELGIALDDLAPFTLPPSDLAKLPGERIGHSRLERSPLILLPAEVYFVLPSACGPAITRFLLEAVVAAGATRPFAAAIAAQYATLFGKTPVLGGSKVPIEFRGTTGGLAAAAMTEIDRGLYLNYIFVADDLANFAEAGVLGSFPQTGDWDELVDYWIQQSWDAARDRPDFVGGLTLIVACGVGRGFSHLGLGAAREGWRVETISAPDLMTLSWLPDFKPLSLWRMLEAEGRLGELNTELFNINGLLNLAAWMHELEGHLAPHDRLPDDVGDAQLLIMVPPNGLRDLRHKVLARWDPHMVQSMLGEWTRVMRDENSMFAEDHRKPFYVQTNGPEVGWPQAVYESPTRNWWCALETSAGTSGAYAFELLRVLKTWVVRFGPILDQAFPKLPSQVQWRVAFRGDVGEHPTELGLARSTYDDALAALKLRVYPQNNLVEIIAEVGFERAFLHAENIAERALVQRTVEGFRDLANAVQDVSQVQALVAAIVPDIHARSQHGFMARQFRDYIRNSVWAAPILVSAEDTALVRLDLGWRYRDRCEGGDIRGKAECTAFLNAVVTGLEDEICNEMRELDRAAVIDFAFMNHESAVVDRSNWHNTAAAVLALHEDKAATRDVLTQKDFEFNVVLQTSRLLVEFALGEAKASGGREPGRLQLSRIMSKLLLIVRLGGWSDAIRWDAMEPRIRITALGDVQANQNFHEEVIAPYARATSELRLSDSMEGYAENTEDPATDDSPLPINDDFPAEFWEAWKEQFGVGMEVVRAFLGVLEDEGMERRQAFFQMRRSELVTACESTAGLKDAAAPLLDQLIFKPRAAWRQTPEGFDARDLFPWRFRRRLSILRRPLVQLTDDADPVLLVAPGIVEDAVRYMLGAFHRGDFHRSQLSPKMNKWAGRKSDRRGHQFALEVAARMQELGWRTRVEEKITALLRKGFPVDYGDVDVLAWKPETGRVIVMECKDVQYRKTDGEIAEQLADFRGLKVDGKRDLLRKHLDRLDVIQKHVTEVQKSLALTVEPNIEGELVFRNPVPMQFAWEQLRAKTDLHVYDTLHMI